MVVGELIPAQIPSGSLTVIEVLVTCRTAVYGSIVLMPMKSPGRIKALGSAEVVMTLVVLPVELVAVMLSADGIAPTHDAIRLTRELADWIN